MFLALGTQDWNPSWVRAREKSESRKLYLKASQGRRDCGSCGQLRLPPTGESRGECVFLIGHRTVPPKQTKHKPS